MFCGHCGKEIPDNAEFCSYCGERLILPEEEKSDSVDEPQIDYRQYTERIHENGGKGAINGINVKRIAPIAAGCVFLLVILTSLIGRVSGGSEPSKTEIASKVETVSTVASVEATQSKPVEPSKTEKKPDIVSQYSIYRTSSDFIQKRAVVKYKENANSIDMALIDDNGFIVMSLGGEQIKELFGWDTYFTSIHMESVNGSYCIYSDNMGTKNKGMIIVDAYGDILFDSRTKEEDAEWYYLGSGNGIYLARKLVKNYSVNKNYLVELDVIGNVIHEEEVKDSLRNCYEANYAGGGLYVMEDRTVNQGFYIYDMDNHSLNKISSDCSKIVDYISDDEIIVYSSGTYHMISKVQLLQEESSLSEVTRIPAGYYSEYGERLFVYRRISGINDDLSGVYDYKGNLIKSFPDSWKIDEIDAFSGGYAAVKLVGADGKAYITIVDNKGNPQYEPLRLDYGVSFPAWHGYVLQNKGSEESRVITPDGKSCSVEDLLKEYPEVTIGWITIRDGLMETNNMYKGSNGRVLDTIYKVSNYKEIADKDIRPDGNTSGENEGSSAAKFSTAVSQKDYKDINNYDIKGKWKNVGEGTYGQAQKGAIISFDGKKCNFFSPNDTYAFYKSGSDYTLDCTSPLANTVSFTVKIVDDNNIDVISGSTIVELQRVS